MPPNHRPPNTPSVHTHRQHNTHVKDLMTPTPHIKRALSQPPPPLLRPPFWHPIRINGRSHDIQRALRDDMFERHELPDRRQGQQEERMHDGEQARQTQGDEEGGTHGPVLGGAEQRVQTRDGGGQGQGGDHADVELEEGRVAVEAVEERGHEGAPDQSHDAGVVELVAPFVDGAGDVVDKVVEC